MMPLDQISSLTAESMLTCVAFMWRVVNSLMTDTAFLALLYGGAS